MFCPFLCHPKKHLVSKLLGTLLNHRHRPAPTGTTRSFDPGEGDFLRGEILLVEQGFNVRSEPGEAAELRSVWAAFCWAELPTRSRDEGDRWVVSGMAGYQEWLAG